MMTELTMEQVERLYSVFDFDDEEEIVCATLLDDGEMEINYIDNRTNANGCYKPYFAKHSQEDKEKLKFIMEGIKLERDE